MPGTIVIDQQETFEGPPIALAVGPKLEYQSDQQVITKNGERKWVVTCAVTYRPDGQMPAQVEVITVGITGGEDPSAVITVGMQIEFNRLRQGVSPVERTEKGYRGGKPWYQASGVRPAAARNGNGRTAATAGATAAA